MPPIPVVREAEGHDTVAIASLLGQLGYPSSPDEVEGRLRQLSTFHSAAIFVAERDGQVVGVSSVHMFPALHISPPFAWLTALVVDAQHAQGGVGRALCVAAEAWAREGGALSISLTSGTHRDGAHAFYRRVGYEETGRRLTKSLR